MSDYKEPRNLDGVYFRIKRNDKYDNVCFSDLTVEERAEILEEKDKAWLARLCEILADALYEVGEEFDILGC